jgi:hypothetical protein
MPLDPNQLRAQLEDPGLNPVNREPKIPGTHDGGPRVTLDLVFDGVPFVPVELLDALETQYGEGSVRGDTDTVSRGLMRWRIRPVSA